MRRIALPLAAACAALLASCADGGSVGNAGSMLRVADAARNSGDVTDAVTFYRQAARSAPTDAAPHAGLARALLRSGDVAGAGREAELAQTLAPSSPDVQVASGLVALGEGRYGQAVQVLQAAVARGSRDVSAFNGLGAALDHLGRHAEAQDQYRRALALDPSNGPVRNNMALSMALSGDLNGAAAALRGLAASRTALPRYRQNLALVLAMQGQAAEATRIAAIDLGPAAAASDVALLRSMRAGSAAGALPVTAAP